MSAPTLLQAQTAEDKRLYAAAFRIAAGGKCLFLSATEQFEACAKRVFARSMPIDKSLHTAMALMLNSNIKAIQVCTACELAKMGLPSPKANELYVCLPFALNQPQLLSSQEQRAFSNIIVKFEQSEKHALIITQVVVN